MTSHHAPSVRAPDTFGSSMYLLDFRAEGAITKDEALAIAKGLVGTMKMSVAPYDPVAWEYPVAGKGGSGVTVVQPLTESLLGIDSYPEWFFVFVKSCLPFDPNALYDAVSEAGYEVRRATAVFREVT